MIHFYRSPGLLRKAAPGLTWSIPTEKQSIFLTFDDGPVPRLTPFIMDILDQFHAKATFFCVGDNIRKYPDIFQKLIQKGHAVGNHTFNHLKAWSCNWQEYLSNVDKCRSEIRKYTELSGKMLFRPPHGQITPRIIKKLLPDYQIIMWNVLTYDFDQGHAADISLHRAIRHTAPGSIVVFHDNYKAEKKLKSILPKYLEYFLQKGFTFEKLGETNHSNS